MTSGEGIGNDQGYYIWHAPGNSMSIHLNLNLIEALTAEHLRAAGSEGEVRGVLLGRSIHVPRPVIFVEGFAPIPRCDRERQGLAGVLKKSWLLPIEPFAGRGAVDECEMAPQASDIDLAEIVFRLHRGVERGRNAIGIVRSQWGGELTPAKRDLKIANRLFSQPENILLLARFSKSRHADAALFCWQNGELQPTHFAHAFPFDCDRLIRRAPIRMLANGSLPGYPYTTNPDTDRKGTRWWRLVPAAALVTLGAIAAQTAFETGKPVAPTLAPAFAAGYQSPLGLNVTALPHQLLIRWNRDSEVIRAAERGEMRIAEGDVAVTEVVPIDKRQLGDGYIAYAPLTNDVSIRFEVKGPDGKTATESVRAVAMPGTN